MVSVLRLRAHADGGQALVEFALITPLLLLLLLGVYEFGRAWNVYQTLSDAVREGGRTAVVANSSITVDSVVARINDNLNRAGIDTAKAVKTISGFHAGTGTPATVSIAYPYQLRWIQGLVGWTGAQALFQMTTSVVFRNE